ncbi:MAG: ThuA domain-containing protein [Agriterribacter sp.]
MRQLLLLLFFLVASVYSRAQQKAAKPAFRALVLYENGGHHLAFTNAAIPWLNQLAAERNFTIDYLQKVDSIDDQFLEKYQVFIQLDYVPYGWPEKAQKAFIKYMEQGKSGWVGLHHASLLGDFDGHKMWHWYHQFMGGIRFKNYIPTFAAAEVSVEDSTHPVVKGLPQKFTITAEEWYTYDKSPRPAVKVIAHVDESTYAPASDIKMGDHPVIWSNPNLRAKNVYIFMGHSPQLLQNPAFTTLLSNAVLWAAGKQ